MGTCKDILRRILIPIYADSHMPRANFGGGPKTCIACVYIPRLSICGFRLTVFVHPGGDLRESICYVLIQVCSHNSAASSSYKPLSLSSSINFTSSSSQASPCAEKAAISSS